MKIKKSDLLKIVREELTHHLSALHEEDEKEKKGKKDDKPDPKDVSIADADSDKKEKKKKSGGKGKGESAPIEPQDDPDNTVGGQKGKKGADPSELPAPEDDAVDSELEKDTEDSGEEEDASDVTGGKISSEIVGMTIQSITMEPDSKTVPGSQEIVITFKQKPDPLRILVGKTGRVKFFYHGLHNEL